MAGSIDGATIFTLVLTVMMSLHKFPLTPFLKLKRRFDFNQLQYRNWNRAWQAINQFHNAFPANRVSYFLVSLAKQLITHISKTELNNAASSGSCV
jgi:hypothetical protein